MTLSFSHYRFKIWLAIIIVLGFAIRIININYSSMWADELYSALLASPRNSWYEVLYMQRAYQPPLYAFILWGWVKIFAYNEFYIRLLTVICGTCCIWVSGYLGKKIKNEKLGLILAVLVAVNPTQIWYSLEARFYVFVYLFASLSLLLYWYVTQAGRPGKRIYFYTVLKAFIDAALCYFHHFGIIFLFAQFINDLIIFKKERDKKTLAIKAGGYALAGLLYLPWIAWGLTEAMHVTQYWLKDIDVGAYFMFSFGYNPVSDIVVIICLLFFLYRAVKQPALRVFPLIVLSIIIIPVIYSYVKMPMLVSRYAMVMAPALYTMVGIGVLYLLEFINKQNRLLYYAVIVTGLFALSLDGISMSFFHKEKIAKQPWRENG